MDPINVQLFKPDSGRPDEWYVRWTNGNSGDTVRQNYQVQAHQRESDGQLTILYPYYDASYTREGVAALILDEDGNLVINKEWYVYGTRTNQSIASLYMCGAILNDELFMLNGGSLAGVTGCENDTSFGSGGVVNLYQNGVGYLGNQLCKNGNGDGPGVWTDHSNAAFISGDSGNGCRIADLRYDKASTSYTSTTTFRDGITIIFPETDQYIQNRKRYRTTGDWNSVHLAAGTCDGATFLPGAQTNSLFYRTGPSSVALSAGYSFGGGTATNCFREIVGGSYYTVAFASVADPWGTPVVRNSGNAYSFGYSTDTVTNYGAVHLPDAYSSFQGLWVHANFTLGTDHILVISDDYYVTDIAQWQYKYSGVPVLWYTYPDAASNEHVIMAYRNSQEMHVMRLHYSSLILGRAFASGGVTAAAPSTAMVRYAGFADQGTQTFSMSAPSAATVQSPAANGVAMTAPTINYFDYDAT